MYRWRTCVLLAMLLLLPTRTTSREDDEEDDRGEEEDENEGDEEEENDEPIEKEPPERRTPTVMYQTRQRTPVTRTAKRRPLECYSCAYKPETSVRACLDPRKYRVNTVICHSADDKCVTSVTTKDNTYEAVIRGCRSACLGSPDTTCCEINRCNNQAFAMPSALAPRALVQRSKSNKALPTSVLFFVTILLVLQTVVKVTIV